MDTTYFKARLESSQRVWPVQSWKQVSQAYTRAVREAGLSVYTVPACHILDEDGSIYAYVSVTGRIFRGEAFKPGAELIYDPRT